MRKCMTVISRRQFIIFPNINTRAQAFRSEAYWWAGALFFAANQNRLDCFVCVACACDISTACVCWLSFCVAFTSINDADSWSWTAITATTTCRALMRRHIYNIIMINNAWHMQAGAVRCGGTVWYADGAITFSFSLALCHFIPLTCAAPPRSTHLDWHSLSRNMIMCGQCQSLHALSRLCAFKWSNDLWLDVRRKEPGQGEDLTNLDKLIGILRLPFWLCFVFAVLHCQCLVLMLKSSSDAIFHVRWASQRARERDST